jgi:hypothetical protein
MDTNQFHYALSVVVAAHIGAEPLRCWRNAALATLTFPRLFDGGIYVEGWIVVARTTTIGIIEHGWCVSPLAGIIDPSVVLTEQRDQPVIYIPGFELTRANLLQSLSGKTVPLVCNSHYGKDGMGHPGYKQSYEQALQHAQDLMQKRHLSEDALHISTRDPQRGVTIIELKEL